MIERYKKDTPTAIEIALEMIEEWNYQENPHGWCHDRTVLIALVEQTLGDN